MLFRSDARELYEHKDATDEKFENFDRVKRKPNLVLYGVPESFSNPKEVAKDLFNKIEVNINPSQVTDAYRLGPNPPHGVTLTRPRPLMLSLQHASLKQGIFKNLSKLAGDPSWKKITVTDDLTPNDQLKKRTLKSVVMQARRQGLSAKLSGNGAFINNQKYDITSLHRLPIACSLEATFSRVIENTVCFQGPHSSLSNFAPVEFDHKGTVYCSSEQAYQAIKAHQCKQPALMAKIMRTQSPYLIKRLGNNINVSSEWEDHKEMVMKIGRAHV